MKPETNGEALLETLARTLAEEVAPGLAGEARFKVLMAASAARMVSRELALAPEAGAAARALGEPSGLVAAIRAGLHDDDAGLHAKLLADAVIRTRISRPAAVE